MLPTEVGTVEPQVLAEMLAAKGAVERGRPEETAAMDAVQFAEWVGQLAASEELAAIWEEATASGAGVTASGDFAWDQNVLLRQIQHRTVEAHSQEQCGLIRT